MKRVVIGEDELTVKSILKNTYSYFCQNWQRLFLYWTALYLVGQLVFWGFLAFIQDPLWLPIGSGLIMGFISLGIWVVLLPFVVSNERIPSFKEVLLILQNQWRQSVLRTIRVLWGLVLSFMLMIMCIAVVSGILIGAFIAFSVLVPEKLKEISVMLGDSPEIFNFLIDNASYILIMFVSIWFFSKLLFITSLLACGDVTGGFKAIRVSWKITRGMVLRMWGTLFMVFVPLGLVNGGLFFAFYSLGALEVISANVVTMGAFVFLSGLWGSVVMGVAMFVWYGALYRLRRPTALAWIQALKKRKSNS